MNSLAVGYHYASKLDRAQPLYEETLRLRKSAYGSDHYDTLTAMNNLAACYKALGQVDKALPLMEETYGIRKTKLGPDHPHTLISMTNLAVVLEAAGKPDEAIPFFEQALASSETKMGPDHPGTLLRISNLANCFRDSGKPGRAAELYHEYTVRIGRKDGRESLAYAGALVAQGFNFVKMERWDAAEPVLRECLALRQQLLPDDNWRIGSTQSLLGAALAGLKRFDEAESLLVAGYAGQRAQQHTIPPNGKSGIAQALERLISFYETRGTDRDAEQAAKWKAERDKASE